MKRHGEARVRAGSRQCARGAKPRAGVSPAVRPGFLVPAVVPDRVLTGGPVSASGDQPVLPHPGLLQDASGVPAVRFPDPQVIGGLLPSGPGGNDFPPPGVLLLAGLGARSLGQAPRTSLSFTDLDRNDHSS